MQSLLLANRRQKLLLIALAGMELGWILPAFIILLSYAQPQFASSLGELGWLRFATFGTPIRVFLFCLGLWIVYALIGDQINRRYVKSPEREGLLLAAMLLTTLLLVRLILHPLVPPFDLGWLSNTARAILNFVDGWQPEIVVISFSLFIWMRIIAATGRVLTFVSVGLSFRLGFLAAVIGSAILFNQFGKSVPLHYFGLFLGFGLAAVSLARIDEKSIVGSHSTGAILPWSRMAVIALAIAFTLAVGLLLTLVYTPQNILVVLEWFSPLWLLLGRVLSALLALLLWLIAPALEWLIETLRSLMEQTEFLRPPAEVELGDDELRVDLTGFSLKEFLQDWPLVQYAFVFLVLVGAALFCWLFFVQPFLRQLSGEDEVIEQEAVNWGLGGLLRSLEHLRNLTSLIRRFGLSLELLDAISVENMYANLGRIARQRGYPRRPNEPPDQYLPSLMEAFPSQEDGLRWLTQAYMRVHYGEQSVSRDELYRLRGAYELIRSASPDTIEMVEKPDAT